MTTTESGPSTRRWPLHLGVLLGLATATYATALAMVTGLQSAADQAAMSDRRPASDALAAATRTNDELAARLDRAAADYDAAVDRYEPLVTDLTRLETAIDHLADGVSRVDRLSGSLPSRVALRSSVAPAPRASRPPAHATTGASGAK